MICGVCCHSQSGRTGMPVAGSLPSSLRVLWIPCTSIAWCVSHYLAELCLVLPEL